MPEPAPGTKISVCYITCSSYSGSTLLSFLLNDHPGIATIGHLTGWPIRLQPEVKGKNFRCSCGALLSECDFFNRMGQIFDAEHLPHSIGEFGTNYRLSDNQRFNRYLVSALPFVRSEALERLRDRLVALVPRFRHAIALQNRANVTFMRNALDITGASVFVDNSHRPQRLRRLVRVPELDLSVIHLVRDYRGVVNSTMQRRNWSPLEATRAWLQEQSDCSYMATQFPRHRLLLYEDLCNDLDGTLSNLHRFVGLEPQPFSGDLNTQEHHILGNQMRLRLGKVENDTRWRTELTVEDLRVIQQTVDRFMARNPHHPVSSIVRRQREMSPI